MGAARHPHTLGSHSSRRGEPRAWRGPDAAGPPEAPRPPLWGAQGPLRTPGSPAVHSGVNPFAPPAPSTGGPAPLQGAPPRQDPEGSARGGGGRPGRGGGGRPGPSPGQRVPAPSPTPTRSLRAGCARPPRRRPPRLGAAPAQDAGRRLPAGCGGPWRPVSMSLGARPTPHAASPAAAIFSPAHTHSHRPPRLRTGRAPRGAGRPGAPGACCACAADRWACAAGAGPVASGSAPLRAAGGRAAHWGAAGCGCGANGGKHRVRR